MIPVTKSLVPSQEKFFSLAEQVLQTRKFTNHGPLVSRLETELRRFLNVSHIDLCANGTLALQLALHLAGLPGKKVITTPFTYVATLSSLLWEGCTPVFADIDEKTLCISPQAVKESLDSDVAGLLPVHVYGNACDVDALEEICQESGIVCVYDAAHAFGVSYKGRSLLDYGDYAVCSFHATKLFHTVEGGCVVSHLDKDSQNMKYMRAFGHIGDTHVCLGINAKMSELHAAVGLCLLPRLNEEIAARKKIITLYDQLLQELPLRRPVLHSGLTYNYSYYPIILSDESTLYAVQKALNVRDIFPRRYFYPSLNRLPYLAPALQTPCPVAEDISRRILCLPLFGDLTENGVRLIASILSDALCSRS